VSEIVEERPVEAPDTPAPHVPAEPVSTTRRLLRRLRGIMAGSDAAQERLDQIVRVVAAEMVAEVCSAYVMRAGEVLELFATEGLRPEAVHRTRLRVGEGLVGRIAAVRDGRALFSGGLRNMFSLADLKMQRLLDTFDAWACGCDAARDVGPPERFPATRVPASTRLQLDLRSGEIRSIVWATGFRPVYPWLHVPVVDEKGHLRHDGGVVDSPGMYALGLPVLRRRKSTFIHGIEDDARDVIDHLAGYLAGAHGERRSAG